jgi:hypothetical protein
MKNILLALIIMLSANGAYAAAPYVHSYDGVMYSTYEEDIPITFFTNCTDAMLPSYASLYQPFGASYDTIYIVYAAPSMSVNYFYFYDYPSVSVVLIPKIRLLANTATTDSVVLARCNMAGICDTFLLIHTATPSTIVYSVSFTNAACDENSADSIFVMNIPFDVGLYESAPSVDNPRFEVLLTSLPYGFQLYYYPIDYSTQYATVSMCGMPTITFNDTCPENPWGIFNTSCDYFYFEVIGDTVNCVSTFITPNKYVALNNTLNVSLEAEFISSSSLTNTFTILSANCDCTPSISSGVLSVINHPRTDFQDMDTLVVLGCNSDGFCDTLTLYMINTMHPSGTEVYLNADEEHTVNIDTLLDALCSPIAVSLVTPPSGGVFNYSSIMGSYYTYNPFGTFSGTSAAVFKFDFPLVYGVDVDFNYTFNYHVSEALFASTFHNTAYCNQNIVPSLLVLGALHATPSSGFTYTAVSSSVTHPITLSGDTIHLPNISSAFTITATACSPVICDTIICYLTPGSSLQTNDTMLVNWMQGRTKKISNDVTLFPFISRLPSFGIANAYVDIGLGKITLFYMQNDTLCTADTVGVGLYKYNTDGSLNCYKELTVYIRYANSPLSIGDGDNPTSVVLYPNPANDEITIKNLPDRCRISLYNTQGTLLTTYKNTEPNEASIRINEYLPGLYFINVNHEDGTSATYKFVKN